MRFTFFKPTAKSASTAQPEEETSAQTNQDVNLAEISQTTRSSNPAPTPKPLPPSDRRLSISSANCISPQQINTDTDIDTSPLPLPHPLILDSPEFTRPRSTGSRRSSRSTIPPPSSPPPCIPLPPIPQTGGSGGAGLPLGARLPLHVPPGRLPLPISAALPPPSPRGLGVQPHTPYGVHASSSSSHLQLPISESTQSLSTAATFSTTTLSSIDIEKAAAATVAPAPLPPNDDSDEAAEAHSHPQTTKPPTKLATFLTAHFGPPDRVIHGLTRNTFLYVLLATVYLLLAGIVAISIVFAPGRGSGGSGSGIGKGPGGGGSGGIETNNPLDLTALHTGDLTYYTPGLGSCGLTHTSSDAVVAISHTVFDAANISGNPNENPLCGRKVRAMRYREDLGRNVTVEAMVVDRCPACKAGDLDVSEAVFAKLARMEMGRVGVVWSWV